jgi:glycosyltransferase involved in cell wall biosynthesis
MHVLVLSFPYSAAYGGGERYLETLIDGLQPRGFDFELVSSSIPLLEIFSRKGLAVRYSQIGPEPVSKWALPLFVLLSPFLLLFMLGHLLRSRARAVICLSLTDKLLATLPAWLLKMRVIWVEHLVPGRALISNPLRTHYAVFSRLATVVAVSQAVTDGLVKLGVSRQHIEIIPPGVTMPEGSAPLAGATVGVVARLAPEKNVALALRVFERLAAEMPEAKLDIFGDGPERPHLAKLAEQLGITNRIHWRGFTENPERIYAHLRVLAVPSRAESFGIAALEAMSWGVPVVATEVGGLPELVRHNVTGLLVPPDDEAALAKALRRVLLDRELTAQLGAAGRAEAEKYSPQRNLAAWEKLLNA